MLPKYHILFGFLFALAMLLVVSPLDAMIIFLATFLIDIDHYIFYVIKKKDFSIKRSYEYYPPLREKEKAFLKKGIKPIHPLSFLHTFEFLLIFAVLSLFSRLFLLIFLGFLFHSLVDVINMAAEKRSYARQYSFFAYILNRKDKKYLS